VGFSHVVNQLHPSHIQGCQIFVDKNTKTGKTYQITTKSPMAIKNTKWPKYISNGHKINQYLSLQDSKIYPKMAFWFENIPSGNPAHALSRLVPG
jgi:hypothetical protein